MTKTDKDEQELIIDVGAIVTFILMNNETNIELKNHIIKMLSRCNHMSKKKFLIDCDIKEYLNSACNVYTTTVMKQKYIIIIHPLLSIDHICIENPEQFPDTDLILIRYHEYNTEDDSIRNLFNTFFIIFKTIGEAFINKEYIAGEIFQWLTGVLMLTNTYNTKCLSDIFNDKKYGKDIRNMMDEYEDDDMFEKQKEFKERFKDIYNLE